MAWRLTRQLGPVIFGACLITFGITLMLPSMRPTLYLTFAPAVSASENIQSQNLVSRGEQTTFKPTGRLQIPSIKLSEEVVEGTGRYELAQSIGRHPRGSLPGAGGNVVMFGHNYYYRGPLFWLLRFVRIGDDITLRFGGQMHRYKVSARKIISPKKLDSYFWVLSDRLTLVTCYPPGTSDKRLLVIARPVE